MSEAPAFESLPMRVGLATYRPLTDDLLSLVAQLGVEDLLLKPNRYKGVESVMPLGEVWSVEQILERRERIESYGIRLYAFEKLPVPIYDILLEDESDERARLIRIVADTIENLGEAGVPVLGYSGHPPQGAVRTDREHPVRGNARSTAFIQSDLEDGDELKFGRRYEEAELWDRYTEFLEAVVPAAESADVTLGVHPSDPPVEELYGVPLLFRSRENFERALDIVPSDNHGLKFCMGCWSEMGEDVPQVIRDLGEHIVYVHFRDVVGTSTSFYETFIDDPDGNFDEYDAMRALDEVGFAGVMEPDHVPMLAGESAWEFGSALGRTYTVGYLKGMLRSLDGSH